jgi:hypothetical protein
MVLEARLGRPLFQTVTLGTYVCYCFFCLIMIVVVCAVAKCNVRFPSDWIDSLSSKIDYM